VLEWYWGRGNEGLFTGQGNRWDRATLDREK